MKFNDIIQKSAPRRVMILTEKQIQTLASSLVSLMEQEQITKTYIINKKPKNSNNFLPNFQEDNL
jgi:hypothetical protein